MAGEAFRDEFAEDKAEVGKDQGDEDHGEIPEGGVCHAHGEAACNTAEDGLEGGHERVGIIEGREGAGQEAGGGDAHLDGGQEAAGFI